MIIVMWEYEVQHWALPDIFLSDVLQVFIQLGNNAMGHKSTWISVAGHVKRNRWSEKDVILNMIFIDKLFLFY